MGLLKLLALDSDDLKIISAHLQDAVVRVEDMAYLPREKRFAALLNRFDWISANERSVANGGGYERRRCALRFEQVLHTRYKNLDPNSPSEVLELLAVDFEPGNEPGGAILLTFAGGAAIQITVDCIEAELRDLGPIWRTALKPDHPEGAN